MPGIKHKATAVDPVPPPPGAINAPNWNDDHEIPGTGVLIGDAATDQVVGVSSNVNFQVLQRKASDYQFTSLPWYFQSDYDFAPISPAQNLTAGVAAVVTLSPFPPGITAQSAGIHKLRIVDLTTLISETVTITAVNVGVSITFTPTNSHSSGDWSIVSGSAGIQEAILAAQQASGGGQVQLKAGNSFIYGTIRLSGIPYVRVQGAGNGITNLVVDTSFTSGDVFYCNAVSQIVVFASFQIGGYATHASGYGIHIGPLSTGHSSVFDVNVVNLANGLFLEDADYTMVSQFVYEQYDNLNAMYGIRCSKGSSITLSRCFIVGEHPPYTLPTSGLLKYGIWVDEIDGLTISQVHLRADRGIQIRGKNALQTGTVIVADSIIDTCRINAMAIDVEPGATPSVMGNFVFSNSHIIASIAAGDNPLVYIEGSKFTGYCSFVNNFVAGAQGSGFDVLNAKNLSICSNLIADNNNSSNPGGAGIRIVNGDMVQLKDNLIFDQRGGGAKQVYGISLGGNISNLREAGNLFKGNTGAALLSNAILTNSLVESTKVFEGSVASAATITLPTFLPGLLIITGTTTISTINGATGAGHVLYIRTDSSLTFSAAGNISTAVTTAAGQLLIARYNGSTSKWDIR